MASSKKVTEQKHLLPEDLVDKLSALQLKKGKQNLFCDIPLLKCIETKNYASRSKVFQFDFFLTILGSYEK